MQRVYANGAMSTCATRHVGGVLVEGNRSRADGFNGNLPGHPHCDEGGCERCNDPNVVSGVGLERCVCVHCEQNIVSYCAARGISMKGTSLYLPATPCVDCAKLVIACGVTELVYVDEYPGAEKTVREFAHLSGVIVRSPHCRCGQRVWEQ